MSSDIRYFSVEGTVYVEREDVIDWLNENRPEEDELDYDYQPTSEEWRSCALEFFSAGAKPKVFFMASLAALL